MDMNKLHYFCTVVQAGSLSKASELLNISQPALSKAIKALEADTGKKLVLPSGRGIAFTDFGKQLAIKANPLIEQIHELDVFDGLVELKNSIRIGTFEVFSTYFLGKVVSEEFKDINIKTYELTPGPMEEAVAAGKIDIGITYLPIPHKDLDFLKVTEVEMGLYGKTSFFKDSDISKVPFVAPNVPVSGTPSKAKGLDGWPDDKHPRNIKYYVAMMETALDLCRRGNCIGYFPKHVVELHNETVLSKYKLDNLDCPLRKKQRKFDVYMIKRKSDLEDAKFKKVSKQLRLILS